MWPLTPGTGNSSPIVESIIESTVQLAVENGVASHH